MRKTLCLLLALAAATVVFAQVRDDDTFVSILERVDTYPSDAFDADQQRRKQIQEKYPSEALASSDWGGDIIRVSFEGDDPKLRGLYGLPYTVQLRFWHGADITKPLYFYEDDEQQDEKGHNVIFGDNIASDHWDEEEGIKVNYIVRKLNGTLPRIFFVPEWIQYLCDYDYEKAAAGKNDTIYATAMVLDNNGVPVAASENCLYWVRRPNKKEPCRHLDCDIKETDVQMEQIGPGEILVTYTAIATCKDCGHVERRPGMRRTAFGEVTTVATDCGGDEREFTTIATDCGGDEREFTTIATNCGGPEEEEEPEHRHSWERFLGPSDFNDALEVTEGNCRKRCIEAEVMLRCFECGAEVSTGTFDRSWQRDCDCFDQEVLVSKKSTTEDRCTTTTYVVETIRNCDGNETSLNRRTVTRTVCKPCEHSHLQQVGKKESDSTPYRFYHITNVVYEYLCPDCGYREYVDGQETHSHRMEKVYKNCQRLKPFGTTIGGVALKMHVVVNKEDSSAVYVAETETTEALWDAVYPGMHDGWEGSQYPVTGVSLKDVKGFISVLNQKAEAGQWPVRFRLPTVDEWLTAYDFGGDDKEGWTNTPLTHQVAEKGNDEAGLYDLLGNVWEMCDSTVTIAVDETETEQWTAVAGKSHQDDNGAKDVHFLNLEQGDAKAGFRLFADLVPGEDDSTPQDVSVSVGERAVQLGYEWAVQNVYQCSVCGCYVAGYLRQERWAGADAPSGCSTKD